MEINERKGDKINIHGEIDNDLVDDYTMVIKNPLDKGHWTVDGIDFLVKDATAQIWVNDGVEVQNIAIDGYVGVKNGKALLKLIESHLATSGHLTFVRGDIKIEARLVEFVYSGSTRGYHMRMEIYPKGYEDEQRKEEPILKVKDVQRYFEKRKMTIKEMRTYV